MSRQAVLPQNWNRGGSKLLYFPGAESAREMAPQSVSLELLRGRLCELSGESPAAQLTLACHWVLEAQRSRETVAWVHTPTSRLHPPDLADAGVDLDRLVFVRVPDATAVARAADFLLRSGGIGLAFLELLDGTPRDRGARSSGWLNRLQGLAIAHGAAVVCMTATADDQPSLASIVGLRVTAALTRQRAAGFTLTADVLKDKRGNPNRRFEETCRGPLGLR